MVTRPTPPVSLGKYGKYGPLYRTVQPRHSAVQWYGTRCGARPFQEQFSFLLIETAKTSRLSSLPISFRVAFFSTL